MVKNLICLFMGHKLYKFTDKHPIFSIRTDGLHADIDICKRCKHLVVHNVKEV